MEADVGHANDGQAIPAFGAHGAARARFADGGGRLAIAEVAGEEAVGDDGRALRGDAFVVVGESAEAGAVFEARVGDNVDDVRAVSAACAAFPMVRKLMPAKFASMPRTRSSSMGWPMDS